MTIAAVASGGLVGFTLGLVGGGGSILATPLLLYGVGVRDPHVAVGTSALAVAVNAWANAAGHAWRGNVRWRCATVFALFGVAGSLAGSLVGKATDPQSLLFLFGLLMLAVAAMMLRRRPAQLTAEKVADGRTCLVTAGAAVVTGAASGFFGIGGGFLIVPALIASTGMPMIKAVGSSLVAVGAFGLATAASYAWSGLVDWPVAGLFIAGGAAGGLLGTAVGSRLALHRQLLDRLLAGLIVIVAFYVLAKSGSALFG